ncbi:MAG: ribbon-helix-helix protein, CopG family [Gammaproteobacteria bacterium]|nr:ribbon-helix-helix protein, CopG family [Gammaproteobacteria bacterium]
MSTLGVRLDSTLDNRLQNLCKQTGRSKSYYAKKALTEFLNNREDYLIGLAVLEQNEDTLTLDELEKHLDLDN